MLRTLNPSCATKVMWGHFHSISTWLHPNINKPRQELTVCTINRQHETKCPSRSCALSWWLAFWQLASVNRSTSRNAVSYIGFLNDHAPCFVHPGIRSHAACTFVRFRMAVLSTEKITSLVYLHKLKFHKNCCLRSDQNQMVGP